MQYISSPKRSKDLVGALSGNLSCEASSPQIANDLVGVQLAANQILSILMRNCKLPRWDIRSKEFIFSIDDLYGLDLEWHLTVLRKGPDDVIETDKGFGSVQGCHLDEDVAGVDWDFGVLAVDDGWDWADDVIAI